MLMCRCAGLISSAARLKLLSWLLAKGRNTGDKSRDCDSPGLVTRAGRKRRLRSIGRRRVCCGAACSSSSSSDDDDCVDDEAVPEVECGGDSTGCTCLSAITLAGLGTFAGLVLALSFKSRVVSMGSAFGFRATLRGSMRL